MESVHQAKKAGTHKEIRPSHLIVSELMCHLYRKGMYHLQRNEMCHLKNLL